MASGTSFSGKSQRLTMEHQRDQTILIVNHPRPQSAEKEPQCNCNVLLNDVILALELLPSSTTARATKTSSIFIHLTAKNVGLQYCPLAVRHINAYQAYACICPVTELHHLSRPHTLHRKSTTTGERVAQKKSLHNAALMDTMPSPKVTPYFSWVDQDMSASFKFYTRL